MSATFRAFVLLSCLIAAIRPAVAQVISLRPNATWTERAAAGDLQRAIYAATGKMLPIRAAKPSDRAAICVGFSPTAGVDLSSKTLGDQGFVLKTVRSRGKTTLVAAGATPVATSYACFALAERYGAGFYLGGDALPVASAAERSGAARTKLPDLNVVAKPAIKIRGVLPWYNFFDSPTAWNAEDYRFFIDQLAKTRNNFLGFHSYDHEPFCAYRNRDGNLTAGAPLNSTAQPTWGTVSMKTSEFAFGADRYFAEEYFGADCSMGYRNPEEGITRAKKLLANALWYAKARGIKTCVGFEVTGDPTAPGALADLDLRLKQLLKDYPMLDYVWIWEPEAMGLNGTAVPPTRSDFGAYVRRWQEQFSYIQEPSRRAEAVRIGIYALAAHRILRREAPRVKMIVSAWGGDNHLRFTDFYPGLDKVLPKGIIFSALDNIVVSDTVSEAYGKLPKDREFWPIPWFEYDGDQWFPQANSRRFFNAARDALKKGASGLLGIHWRTRDVEESHAYVSQFAWNTSLGYEEFYRDYARKSLGDQRAADLLIALQDLGYRWIGGGGQMECGGFQWSPAPEDGVKKLDVILSNGPHRRRGCIGKEVTLEKRDFLRSAVKNLAHGPEILRGAQNDERNAGEGIDYVMNTACWAINFDAAARLLHGGGEIRAMLNKLKAEKRDPTPDEKNLLVRRVQEATRALQQAMLCYSRRVSNRGELGVLATINAKAWADLRDVRKAVEQFAGPLPTPPIEEGDLAVNSILRLTTAYANRPFRISAVVHSASGAASARVFHRSPGGAWQSSPLRFANKGRLEGAIPASAIKGNLVEYYIQVTGGTSKATWPSNAPGEVARLTIVPEPRPAPVPAGGLRAVVAATSVARATTGPLLVQIEWPDDPTVEIFRVTRKAAGEKDRAEIALTRDTWFEDRTVKAGETYSYLVIDALHDKHYHAVSEPITVPEPSVPTPPEIRAVAAPGRVRVRWEGGGIEVGGYSLYRAGSPDGPFTKEGTTGPDLSRAGDRSFSVQAEPGKPGWYQVRALSLSGRESAPSNIVECIPLPADGPPIVSLDFDGAHKIDVPNRLIEDGLPAFRTSRDSFVAIPHSDSFNTGEEITIEFMVKLMSPGWIPVFASHGQFDIDGFFVQYFAGGVRFFLGGIGVLDAGSLQIGKWTHVVATYDGARMVLYLNGVEAGSCPAGGSILPAHRTLHIGRYELPGKEFEVDAFIGAFRLHGYALSPEQITSRYQALAAQINRR